MKFQIIGASGLIHNQFHMDKPAPKQVFQQHFCGKFIVGLLNILIHRNIPGISSMIIFLISHQNHML